MSGSCDHLSTLRQCVRSASITDVLWRLSLRSVTFCVQTWRWVKNVKTSVEWQPVVVSVSKQTLGCHSRFHWRLSSYVITSEPLPMDVCRNTFTASADDTLQRATQPNLHISGFKYRRGRGIRIHGRLLLKPHSSFIVFSAGLPTLLTSISLL